MELTKDEFDEGRKLLGKPNDEILDWLQSCNFDLEDDAYQVFGIFETHHYLDELLRDGQLPDILFESELIDESRYDQLCEGDDPSHEEIELCKIQLLKSNRDDYPEGSMIFFGKISHGSDVLYVFTKRFGDSFDGVTVHLLGIFQDLHSAEQSMFQDGLFLREENIDV